MVFQYLYTRDAGGQGEVLRAISRRKMIRCASGPKQLHVYLLCTADFHVRVTKMKVLQSLLKIDEATEVRTEVPSHFKIS